jgi:hypothetical protein
MELASAQTEILWELNAPGAYAHMKTGNQNKAEITYSDFGDLKIIWSSSETRSHD